MSVEDGTQNSQQSEQGGDQSQTNSDQSQNQDQSQNNAGDGDAQKSLVSGENKDGNQAEFVPLTAADITIPEGLEINDAIRDEALVIVNNRELSPKEQLQGLLDLQGRLAKEASEGISKTWEDTQKAWQDEVKADPTIGGDKLQSTLAAVNKLVTEYGDDKLVEAFAITGAGNNVHVIRFLNTVATKLTEGKPVPGAAPTNQEVDVAKKLFPNMN